MREYEQKGHDHLVIKQISLWRFLKKFQMHTSFCHRGQGVPCSDSFLCTWHGHRRGGCFGCCSYHVCLAWRFPGGQRAGPTYGQPSHARLRKIVAGTRGGQCWAWQSWQCAMVKRETCGANRCDQIYPMLEPSFSYKFWLSPCRNEVLAAMDAFWNKTFQAQGWCCVMQNQQVELLSSSMNEIPSEVQRNGMCVAWRLKKQLEKKFKPRRQTFCWNQPA